MALTRKVQISPSALKPAEIEGETRFSQPDFKVFCGSHAAYRERSVIMAGSWSGQSGG